MDVGLGYLSSVSATTWPQEEVSMFSRPVIRLEDALGVPVPAVHARPPQVPQPGRPPVGVIGDQRARMSSEAGYPRAYAVGYIGPRGGAERANAKAPRELPSVGSAGHAFGTCKPCGFFYAKGCLNGTACSFCHLCDRGEKKRRQKQKKASLKGGA